MGNLHCLRRHAEEPGSEGLDVRFWYPRCAQMRVDVAREYILRLDGAQSIGVAGIGGPAASAVASLARTLPDR